MLDILPAEVAAVDHEDMLGGALAWPDMLAAALERPVRVDVRRPRRVLVAGLGGSAISGDYCARWADRSGTVPVVVRRDYHAPAWVDADTLVVAVSYSGNTEETLASFAEARRRGAPIVAVSTGGELRRFAEKAGAPFVEVQGGLQPRAAMPHVLAAVARVLEAAGALPEASQTLESAVPDLRKLVPDLGADAPPSRNEAKRLALAIEGTVAAVYGEGIMAPAARRFANQLNENSKVLAWSGEMPEMNHNELVGWSEEDDLDRFTAVFLRHSAEIPQVRERFEFTAKLVQERGGRVAQVSAPAATPVAEALGATLLGDATSVYLAARRAKDPTPVAVISGLKQKVGALGLTEKLRHEV